MSVTPVRNQSPFVVTGTITPSATANTNGAPFVVTPPTGYAYMEVVHVGISNAGVATETITMTAQGNMADGTTPSNTNTYTSNTGDMDNQHYLEPAWGIGAGSGLSYNPKCTSFSMVEQSTIASSAASAVVRVWARAYN